jgi:hypothetical protein
VTVAFRPEWDVERYVSIFVIAVRAATRELPGSTCVNFHIETFDKSAHPKVAKGRQLAILETCVFLGDF